METLAPTNFPYVITRACTALPHTPAFRTLPDGFLRVVLRIVQKINIKSPFAGIFASRATIAEESGKSTDTVHRAVKWLEDNGFIERERKAFFGNRGSTSLITPTHNFLHALNIVNAEGKTGATDSSPSPGAGGSKEGAKPPACIPTARPNEKRTSFVKICGVSVPGDLAWLCEKGVSAYGVLALMRSASNVQQRLSDVMTTARRYVEDLSGREIFAYVKKLLACGRDFSQVAKESEEIQKTAEISEFLSNKLRDMEGRRYFARKGNRLFEVDGGVLYEIRADGTRFVHLISEAFIEALHDGRIVPHRENQ